MNQVLDSEQGRGRVLELKAKSYEHVWKIIIPGPGLGAGAAAIHQNKTQIREKNK